MTKTRMRFLPISDTHGKLRVINELAERTQADAVIHAGDFGFYADDSYERLVGYAKEILDTHNRARRARRRRWWRHS